MARTTTNEAISVMEVRTGQLHIHLLGNSPLIFNAMSEKERQRTLLPPGKKTAADKAESLRHYPIEEFRSSIYAHKDDSHPTRLMFPGGAIKKAMANAALDLVGVKKAQIGRLVWVNESEVDIFGVPQLLMSVVRNSGIERTPDIRSRAIVPAWACKVSVNYAKPHIKEQSILNLLAAAGMFIGIGDWRQEKGSGSYGQFKIVGEDDKAFPSILRTGGRVVQDKALADPSCYDVETEKLLRWYDAEVIKLGSDDRTRKQRRPVAA